MMKLSVLIPTNNVSNNTIKTVSSIKFHDIMFEILVVIDSVSNIDEEAYNKLFKISHVKIIKNNSRSGIAETLNCGLVHATGEYILRLDDGDINLRSDLTEELERLKSCDLLCASMLVKDERRQSVIVVTPRIIYRAGRLSPFSRVPHPTWIFKRDNVKTLYQSNDHRCEDFGFLVRNSFKIDYVERLAIQYDVCNKLNYVSELKSIFCKWKICYKSFSIHWIMIECTFYALVRLIRLSITTRKVI